MVAGSGGGGVRLVQVLREFKPQPQRPEKGQRRVEFCAVQDQPGQQRFRAGPAAGLPPGARWNQHTPWARGGAGAGAGATLTPHGPFNSPSPTEASRQGNKTSKYKTIKCSNVATTEPDASDPSLSVCILCSKESSVRQQLAWEHGPQPRVECGGRGGLCHRQWSPSPRGPRMSRRTLPVTV